MNCSKCESENEWGNFCSNCGMQLRTKCPECGKMEIIGRPVCEAEIFQIKEEMRDFVWKKEKPYTLAVMIPCACILVLLSAAGMFIVEEGKGQVLIAAGICVVMVVMAVCVYVVTESTIMKKFSQKAEAEFFRFHPDYAELLKKAERE